MALPALLFPWLMGQNGCIRASGRFESRYRDLSTPPRIQSGTRSLRCYPGSRAGQSCHAYRIAVPSGIELGLSLTKGIGVARSSAATAGRLGGNLLLLARLKLRTKIFAWIHAQVSSLGLHWKIKRYHLDMRNSSSLLEAAEKFLGPARRTLGILSPAL